MLQAAPAFGSTFESRERGSSPSTRLGGHSPNSRRASQLPSMPRVRPSKPGGSHDTRQAHKKLAALRREGSDVLPELRGEPRGTCKKNKVGEHLGIGCRHWSVRPLRPLVLVGAAEGGAKSRRRSAWCPALRLLAPARRRRVYRGGVRRVLRRPRRVGHSGRGLEDVPHLVASALLPDSPQQDGSSPRYAQLNIHERLSAQSAGGQADLAPPRLQV